MTGTKFSDPERTAAGERRASVPLAALRTLWFNTGTLCNVTCAGCYIESSPLNDRLVYLGRAEAAAFLDEARLRCPELVEIGFTGGEPFMNREVPAMMRDALAGGWRVLMLTNAMRPMQRAAADLLGLQRDFPGRLTMRVSLDHHTEAGHEAVRGAGTWAPAIAGLRFLAAHGFDVAVAGRTRWDETTDSLRDGYQALFDALGLALQARDPARLVLFPEMDAAREVPEISEGCWGIFGKQPSDVMCASSRMIVKRRGAAAPAVVSCTLLPYEAGFELGGTLAEAAVPVRLNHRLCAQFCVLGGGSCSPG